MNGSTLLRPGALVIGLGVAPLALAQFPPQVLGAATPGPPWSFIATMAGMGMLLAVGIIAIVFFNESRRSREKLALVERLLAEGKPVPRELMVNELRQLTLPEERRQDMRRGITWLCWALGIAVVFYFVSGRQPSALAWGLLPLILSLGSFLKAWLTAREIARSAAGGPR